MSLQELLYSNVIAHMRVLNFDAADILDEAIKLDSATPLTKHVNKVRSAEGLSAKVGKLCDELEICITETRVFLLIARAARKLQYLELSECIEDGICTACTTRKSCYTEELIIQYQRKLFSKLLDHLTELGSHKQKRDYMERMAAADNAQITGDGWETDRHTTTVHMSFHVFGMPNITGDYHKRQSVELVIRNTLQAFCTKPNDVPLVITGDNGVGKTFTMAQFISDKTNETFFMTECKVDCVVWLKCFDWRDKFENAQTLKSSFTKRLVDVLRTQDSKFEAKAEQSLKEVLKELRQIYGRPLFICDDVFCDDNGNILTFIRTQLNNIPCCVITSDLFTIERLQRKCGFNLTDRKFLTIDEWEIEDFADIFKKESVIKNLSPEQHRFLASRCCRLALILTIIPTRFKHEITRRSSFSAMKQKEAEDQCSRALQDLNKILLDLVLNDEQYPTIPARFLFHIERLLKERKPTNKRNLAAMYLGFLFFNPEDPVAHSDLAYFWGVGDDDASKYCEMYNLKSLVRRDSTRTFTGFWVHHCLYQVVFDCAVKCSRGRYATKHAEAMNEIRRDILLRNLCQLDLLENASLTSMIPPPSTQILVAVMEGNRRDLLERIFEVVDWKLLLEICQLIEGVPSNVIYLSYLFNFKWKDDIISRRPGNRETVRHSHLLVLGILQKLSHYLKDIVAEFSKAKWESFKEQLYPWETKRKRAKMRSEFDHHANANRSWGELSAANTMTLTTNIMDDEQVEWHGNITYLNIIKIIYGEGRIHHSLNWLLARRGTGPNPIAAISKQDRDLLYDKDKLILQLHYDTISSDRISKLLSAAAFKGDRDSVELLCKKQPSVDENASLFFGRTALSFAAEKGNCDIVHILCNVWGESAVKLVDNYGMTPLSYASKCNHREIIKILYAIYPEAVGLEEDEFCKTPLIYAVENDNLDIVKLFCRQGPEAACYKNARDETPMHFAARHGNLYVMNDILYESYPEATKIIDCCGRTPLHVAAVNDQPDVYIFLYAKDKEAAKIHSPKSPLEEAIAGGNLKAEQVIKSIDECDRKSEVFFENCEATSEVFVNTTLPSTPVKKASSPIAAFFQELDNYIRKIYSTSASDVNRSCSSSSEYTDSPTKLTHVRPLQSADKLTRKSSPPDPSPGPSSINNIPACIQKKTENILLFQTVDREWQQNVTEKLFDGKAPISLIPSSVSSVNRTVDRSTAPSQKVEIERDGACFFRSLSYWVFGDEDLHLIIREKICQYIEQYGDYLSLPRDGIGYVKDKRMRRRETFAERIEIDAAAAMLNTTIHVFSEIQWETFAPGQWEASPSSNRAIYLLLDGVHYQPVLSVKPSNIPNTSSFKPL